MSKELKEELIKKECLGYKTEKAQEKHAKFLKSYYDDVFMLDGSYFVIHKPSIQTRFCFGYGMYLQSTDEEQDRAYNNAREMQTNAQHFINENLEELNSKIAHLKYFLIDDYEEQRKYYQEHEKFIYYGNTMKEPYIAQTYSGDRDIVNIQYHRADEPLPSYVRRKATKQELELVLSEYEKARERFVKRLNTYLKKYGLSKLTVWTYLVD